MKKTIASVLLTGAILLGAASTTSVSASIKDNLDGTQTVIGEPNVSVDFTGSIGQFDPGTTDPTVPGVPPAGDDGWIKVTLPTSAAYYSTGTSQHKEIASSEYTVKNESAYPVAVKLSGFTADDGISTPDTQLIDTLSLNVGNTKVFDLVSAGGNAEDPSATTPLMFKLGANAQDPNHNMDNTSFSTEATFNFTGKTDGTPSILTSQTQIDNKLHLTLVSLDADGNEV